MKIYKLHISMMLILTALAKFRLYEYNHEEAIIFIEANNPDEACYKAFFKLSEIVLKQATTEKDRIEAATLLEELHHDFLIKKVCVAQ